MEAIEFNHVSFRYFTRAEETEALRDVNFTVKEGEMVSLVGPSGCGKSTLLSLISGMSLPNEGEIRLFGKEVKEPSPRVGYMLQHDHLFAWRDVLHNVLVGAEIRGMNCKDACTRALELLDRYGLKEFSHYTPGQLSGGMRQRVALIRTLVAQPDLLILDEPFSALDYQTRLRLSDEIWGILRDQGKTAILVTHDLSEAISMSDRVLVMSERPGTIKSEHRIQFFSGERPPPLLARQTTGYQDFFNIIWKELEGSGETA